MEPRPDDGDDVAEHARQHMRRVAAMEPRPDDGDDVALRRRDVRPGLAAMEPRPDDGDDDAIVAEAVADGMTPQWSPALTTGTTPSAPHRTRRQSCRNGAPP